MEDRLTKFEQEVSTAQEDAEGQEGPADGIPRQGQRIAVYV